MAKDTTLQLIYIHGFRGDHTSFQAFPTDLHEHLLPLLPPRIKLESCIYPTYKSVRPISEATQHFLDWLALQPDGHVILLAHSMGGLLAAEAATASVPQAKRIIGLVNFDVPLLGMHPHVVISGIASLFPKDGEGQTMKTEKEMNDTSQVKITPMSVDDEWESFKATIKVPSPNASRSSLTSPRSPRSPRSPSNSQSPSLSSGRLSSSLRILSKAADIVLSNYTEDPVVEWFQKNSDDPLSAMKRWIVEHFEFGICMFDPSGLRDRYRLLERWNGRWTNYWTETVPESAITGSVEQDTSDEHSVLPSNTANMRSIEDTSSSATRPDHRRSSEEVPENTTPLSEKQLKKADKAQAKAMKDAQKALKKQRELERKRQKPRPARHFIVLPFSFGIEIVGAREHWQMVRIAGVKDEVAAHCGLFIKEQNLDYDALIKRVGALVAGWCRAGMDKSL